MQNETQSPSVPLLSRRAATRASMTSRVLIDASNLRAGGGVQVAASFLDELVSLVTDQEMIKIYPWLSSGLAIEASSAVLDNMTSDPVLLKVVQRERRWANHTIWWPRSFKYEVSFVVFGPEYGVHRAHCRIVGFADGVSLHPAKSTMTKKFGGRLKWKIRAHMSKALFGAVDRIVVEAPHVKRALEEKWNISSDRIQVVPNTLNGVFSDPLSWQPIQLPATRQAATYRVCYVTRAYPHKNLRLLGGVGAKLREDHGLETRFIVTLTKDEWMMQDPQFHEFSINMGPLLVAQLPSLYATCDASIFPSLLESFSVTPLEALASGCPLAGSDRDFVRDIAGDSALYFDPQDPTSTANMLAEILTSPTKQGDLRASGISRARNWPTGRDRALSYLGMIDSVLGENR